MSRKHQGIEMVIMLVLACLVSILLSPHADGNEDGSVDSVRSILSQVMAIQTNPKTAGSAHREERKRAIKAVIARNFDMDRMARDALGDYWERLDRRQQTEFTSIFRDLFQDSYTRLVLDFLQEEKIRYSPGEPKGGGALVKTVILRPNEDIPVDYLLERVKDGWLVRDVAIDGVSIVGKYHDAFSRVIRTSSYGVLIDRMRLQQKAIHENP